MAIPSFEPIHDARLATLTLECMARVRRRLDDARLPAELRAALVAHWDAFQAAHEHRRRSGRMAGVLPPWLNRMAGLFLMVVAGEGGELDDAVLDAAAGCELYVVSVSLFDVVQDDELDGPLRALGPALAINAALVVFVQAHEAMLPLIERMPAEPRSWMHASFVERSLTSGRGQHRDLAGVRPASVEQAAAQAQDKTEAIAMVAELAALAAGCDRERAARYGRLGRWSALLRQCANDLADLYGKRQSDDLRTGKWTLPLVAYWERADDEGREALLRLRGELPGSLDAIRRAMFESGAVRRVAMVMEQARQGVHATIAELGQGDGPIAMLGTHADITAARLYSIPSARSTARARPETRAAAPR